MLNLYRESQGRIDSHKYFRENIKHVPLILGWSIVLTIQQDKRMKMFWKNCSCDNEGIYNLVGFRNNLHRVPLYDGWFSKYLSKVFKWWTSVWLLFNAKWAILPAISWREQITFWRDGDVSFVQDQHTRLFFFYSASSLKQQSADRHVAPLQHIILILSQPVFVLRQGQ